MILRRFLLCRKRLSSRSMQTFQTQSWCRKSDSICKQLFLLITPLHSSTTTVPWWMEPGNKSLHFTISEKSFQWFSYETLHKNLDCPRPRGIPNTVTWALGGRVSKGTTQTLSAMATLTYERRNATPNLGISFH